jgi:hypothetical protein
MQNLFETPRRRDAEKNLPIFRAAVATPNFSSHASQEQRAHNASTSFVQTLNVFSPLVFSAPRRLGVEIGFSK